MAWLNTEGSTLRDSDQEITILPGSSVIEQPLEFPLSDIFLRLRCRPSPQDPRAFSEHRGIVAISQIAPHAFELKIGHAEGVRPGPRFTVHAQAIQPTAAPPSRVFSGPPN